MADSQVTPTTMSPEKKLDGARELRGLILRHRQQQTRRASWRHLW